MDGKYSGPIEGQVGKEARKFQYMQQVIDKVILRLDEAINNAHNSFAPVLVPEGSNVLQPTGNSKETAGPVPALSDLDLLIKTTEERIYAAAKLLDAICERSTV